MIKGRNAEYYIGRIEAAEDYIFTADQVDWKTMAAILGLSIPTTTVKKKELDVYAPTRKERL